MDVQACLLQYPGSRSSLPFIWRGGETCPCQCVMASGCTCPCQCVMASRCTCPCPCVMASRCTCPCQCVMASRCTCPCLMASRCTCPCQCVMASRCTARGYFIFNKMFYPLFVYALLVCSASPAHIILAPQPTLY